MEGATGDESTALASAGAGEVHDPPPIDEVVALVSARLRAVLPDGWGLADGRSRSTGADAAWTLRAPAGESAPLAVWSRAGGLEPQLPRPRRLPEGGRRAVPGGAVPVRVGARPPRGQRCEPRRRHGEPPARAVPARGLHRALRRDQGPWPTGDALRTLRGRAAGRAIRALVDHAPPFGVRDIAKRASVPLGSLARTLDLLDREDLVTRGPRGDVRALDWEGAVRRWALDYDLARSNRLGTYTHPEGPEAFSPNLLHPKRPYAVSGRRGAELLLGRAASGPMVLYVEDLDLGVERLGLEPAEGEAADVVLAEGYDRVVFDRPVLRDGLRVAAPSQLAADLLTWPPGPSGPRPVADEVLTWMRADPSRWQHPSPSTTDHRGARP